MEEEKKDSQTETVAEETVETTEEKTTETKVEDKSKDLQSALAQKEHFKAKFEKSEAEKKALEAKLKESGNSTKPTLGVDDYIDISASLEGLDQREKSYLAEQHKLTNKPLKDIRNSEDFGLWQSAYRSKVEKEKSLAPSSKQPDADRPKTLAEKLQGASMADKEKLLSEAGLWKSPRPKVDRVKLG